MLNFQKVSRGIDVTDATGQVGCRGSFQLAEAFGAFAVGVLDTNHSCDQLSLIIDQSPLAAVRLDQSGNEQIVIIWVKDVQEQIRPSVAPIQIGLVDKRKADFEAGREDDQIDFRFAAVRKADATTAQFDDIRFRLDLAVAKKIV